MLAGQRSGLQTHIATTESVFVVCSGKKLTFFLHFQITLIAAKKSPRVKIRSEQKRTRKPLASTLSCSFAQRNGPSRRRAPKDTLRKSQRRCTGRACRLHREMARRRQKCSRTLQMASRRRQEQKALCTRKQRPSFLSNNASRIRLPLSRPYNHSRPNDSASEIRWAPR